MRPRPVSGRIVSESNSSLPDQDIVRLLEARRYHEAFTPLVAAFKDRVFRLAVSLLHHEAHAEDVAQEVFVKIWKGLPAYHGGASLSTWIYAITRNTCLTELKHRGYKVLIAGNQPIESEAALARLDVPADLIASSAGWGISKPAPRFFAKVIEAAGEPPEHIAYVGDRLDNDVLPTVAAGMKAVFVRRGPWGWMHAERPEIEQAHIRLDTLLDLPARLAAL